MKSNSAPVEKSVSEKYLTFLIDGQLYALPTRQVSEIIRMQPITFMPRLPEYIRGVINLRGKIVPMVDMRLKFGKPLREYDGKTSTVIVEFEGSSVGLIADTVYDVRNIAENQICPPPKGKSRGGVSYISGIATFENNVAMVLDLKKLLSGESAPAREETDDEAEQAADPAEKEI